MTVLVLDIGSSSVRALLFNDRAQPIPGALVSHKHRLNHEPPGAATLDMNPLQASVEACIDQILQHPQANNIRVVGIDTLAGNALGVDGEGMAITPVYTYADTRSGEDVTLLRGRIDVEDTHRRTGCILHTAYHPSRLHWLKRAEPALFNRVAQWVDIGTFLYRQWFGDGACSYSIASWSGLLNRATRDWDEAWLDVLGMSRETLPPLNDYSAVQTGLTPAYASRWRQLRDAPFCLAVGDGVAANVGSGCVDRDHLALTIGTTAALRTVTDAALPPVPPGLWSYRVDAGLHLIGGATSEGGNIFRWARDTLSFDGAQNLEGALAGRTPDAHGLTFLPLLAGERSPGWATDATGAVAGMRLSTTPLDLLQAALEGVAHRLALIAGQLRSVLSETFTVVASGGALVSSPAWAQMVSNALDCPLQMTNESELTARGAAILALRALGLCSLTDFPPTITGTVTPNPEHVAIMRAARERQAWLYTALVQREPYPQETGDSR